MLERCSQREFHGAFHTQSKSIMLFILNNTTGRGIARAGPRGEGGAHLEFEHFTRTTPESSGKTMNLGISRRPPPEPRGVFEPL